MWAPFNSMAAWCVPAINTFSWFSDACSLRKTPDLMQILNCLASAMPPRIRCRKYECSYTFYRKEINHSTWINKKVHLCLSNICYWLKNSLSYQPKKGLCNHFIHFRFDSAFLLAHAILPRSHSRQQEWFTICVTKCVCMSVSFLMKSCI